MSSVDELCQSYLDLKYHFDPAAASSAGLVSQDGRLGQFDPDAVRAHVSALRAVAGGVEELEAAELQDEIDRTALLGELRSAIFRLEHERPHARNPVFWVNHLFQGLYAVLARSDGATGGRAPAALERLRAVPGFLDSARATLDAPPSVFVDSALAMLGGGGELVVQLAATLGAEAPGLQDDFRAAAGGALEALKRFGTALRDDIEPDADPHAFAIGEEQFARRLHFEHAIMAGAPELWRYGRRLQEETTVQLAALAAKFGPQPWRELVDTLRDDAPEGDDLLGIYRDVPLPVITSRKDSLDSTLATLRERLRGRVTVFVGSSGVGKSTLVNALVPDSKQRVGSVSATTGKGLHTTTAAIALPLPAGDGWVVDTPGVRSFGLAHVDPDRLVRCFPDLVPGTDECPTDCDHLDVEVCCLDDYVEAGHAHPERLDSLRRLLVSRSAD